MTPNDLETAIRDAMAAGDWHLAESLATILDAADRRPAATLVGAALWYAGVGLPVFPLRPGTKIPLPRSRGFRDATTDPSRIRTWWNRLPTANVAVATGHGVDVIDIDGPVGVQSWAAAEAIPGVIGVVSTPRPGGSHLYVPSTGDGNRARIRPGIDYRGRGGYAVLPPSVITPGVDVPHPGPYRWRRPLTYEHGRADA